MVFPPFIPIDAYYELAAQYMDRTFDDLEVYNNAFYVDSAEDVILHTTGRCLPKQRILSYLRTNFSVRFYSYDVDELFEMTNKKMREAAFYLGANAVVGYEREVYLWEDPPYCEGKGTCVIAGPVQ